jgi:hypothetical protein
MIQEGGGEAKYQKGESDGWPFIIIPKPQSFYREWNWVYHSEKVQPACVKKQFEGRIYV